MIAEPGPIQQMLADKQMALVNGAPQARKGRADHDYPAVAGALEERVTDRADIAIFTGVERGRVLEVEPLRAALPQALGGLHGGGYCFRDAGTADLQGHDQSVRLDRAALKARR